MSWESSVNRFRPILVCRLVAQPPPPRLSPSLLLFAGTLVVLVVITLALPPLPRVVDRSDAVDGNTNVDDDGGQCRLAADAFES